MSRSNSSLLSTLVARFRNGSQMRVHARHACRLSARAELPEKALGLDGMILEVSKGGILFREASRYVLDRKGAAIVVHLPGLELRGEIVNVSPAGYGVRLASLLSDDAIANLLARRAAA